MYYPPPAWRLRGKGVLRLQTLPIEQVRQVVPPELSIISVAPGRTVGGLFLAHYGAGSTREYHELIIFPAMVRQGVRAGAWISHIYVDDLQSLAAGREIWGLPKVFARFNWRETSTGTEVAVADDRATLCSVVADRARKSLALPLIAPVVSRQRQSLLSFAGKGNAKISTGHCDVYIPKAAPFSGFGLTEGRCFRIDPFNLTLPEPELVGSH